MLRSVGPYKVAMSLCADFGIIEADRQGSRDFFTFFKFLFEFEFLEFFFEFEFFYLRYRWRRAGLRRWSRSGRCRRIWPNSRRRWRRLGGRRRRGDPRPRRPRTTPGWIADRTRWRRWRWCERWHCWTQMIGRQLVSVVLATVWCIMQRFTSSGSIWFDFLKKWRFTKNWKSFKILFGKT